MHHRSTFYRVQSSVCRLRSTERRCEIYCQLRPSNHRPRDGSGPLPPPPRRQRVFTHSSRQLGGYCCCCRLPSNRVRPACLAGSVIYWVSRRRSCVLPVNAKQSQVAARRRLRGSVEVGRKGKSSCSARREETRIAIDAMTDELDRLGIIPRFHVLDQLRSLCRFCASSAQ